MFHYMRLHFAGEHTDTQDACSPVALDFCCCAFQMQMLSKTQLREEPLLVPSPYATDSGRKCSGTKCTCFAVISLTFYVVPS
jgi:hypothetical protein